MVVSKYLWKNNDKHQKNTDNHLFTKMKEFFTRTYNRNRSFQTGDKVFGLTLVVLMNFAGSAPLKDLPKPP